MPAKKLAENTDKRAVLKTAFISALPTLIAATVVFLVSAYFHYSTNFILLSHSYKFDDFDKSTFYVNDYILLNPGPANLDSAGLSVEFPSPPIWSKSIDDDPCARWFRDEVLNKKAQVYYKPLRNDEKMSPGSKRSLALITKDQALLPKLNDVETLSATGRGMEPSTVQKELRHKMTWQWIMGILLLATGFCQFIRKRTKLEEDIKTLGDQVKKLSPKVDVLEQKELLDGQGLAEESIANLVKRLEQKP